MSSRELHFIAVLRWRLAAWPEPAAPSEACAPDSSMTSEMAASFEYTGMHMSVRVQV